MLKHYVNILFFLGGIKINYLGNIFNFLYRTKLDEINQSTLVTETVLFEDETVTVFWTNTYVLEYCSLGNTHNNHH